MHAQEDAGTLFEGLTFVLTGTLPTLSRAQAQEMIRKTAAKQPEAYQEDSVVLAGESAGSKLDKARELGVKHRRGAVLQMIEDGSARAEGRLKHLPRNNEKNSVEVGHFLL